MSKRRFPNSTRYRYYDKHNNPQYVYCNYDPSVKPKSSGAQTVYSIVILLFYVPFVIAIGSLLFQSIHIPKPISTNPHSQIIIEDNLNIIKDKNTLIKELTEFYNATGVTPAVLTVPQDDYYRKYGSMSDFNIEEYYRLFSDEYHWLITYSEQYNIRGELIDWNWEGTIGDDTIDIISYKTCDIMTEKMQSHLQTNDFETALIKTFNDIEPECRKIQISTVEFIIGLVFGAFIIIHYLLMSGALARNKPKYIQNAVRDDNTDNNTTTSSQYDIITCVYCNKTYNATTNERCPFCNAQSFRYNATPDYMTEQSSGIDLENSAIDKNMLK